MKERTRKDKILTGVLTPLSWIYGAGVYMRNKLFDFHILPSQRFDIPVISVGNITVGGTGKTPHVEWLIEQLSSDFNIAVLSRGYKRKTKGFVLATPHSTPSTIGDEPYQIYRKFRRVARVAVCEGRRTGIKRLMELYPDLNLIILDDALQHRYVDPKVSVLLMDWSRRVHTDHLLPLGRLRESTSAINRADFVVVTKVPRNVKPVDLMLVKKELDLMAYQQLLFTRFKYSPPAPVFEESARYSVHLDRLDKKDIVMVLTGIANPRGLVKHLMEYDFRMYVQHYPDHYSFSRKDLEKLAEIFHGLNGARKLILTTEKDAVRLASNPYFPESLKPFIYYLPISVESVDVSGADDVRDRFVSAIRSKD